MERLKKAPYAILGTGDLAAERAKALLDKARSIGAPEIVGVYEGLADRGQALTKRLQRSRPAKRAVEGTKQASRQLKGAATSLRKALGMEEQSRSTRRAS
ncbi:MAG: hypothetical protein ACRDIZ_04020 [Actinomycetota bacterium]